MKRRCSLRCPLSKDSPPVKKFRNIEDHRERAARIIQEWVRRNAAYDDIRLQKIESKQDVVKIVEPKGHASYMSARSLVTMFLRRADFHHPLTRREFLKPEVLRVSRSCYPALKNVTKALVEETYINRRAIKDSMSLNESLGFFLKENCARCLDEALILAENIPFYKDVTGEGTPGLAFEEIERKMMIEMNAYASNMRTLLRSLDEEHSLQLIEHHKELVQRRTHLLDYDLHNIIVTELADVAEIVMFEGFSRNGHSVSAIGTWIHRLV